ncbi:MAG: sensor histidine kinase [Rikenellaceae bacterium]|jgi:hypothetical protein|nr:sensor histidine kinase [Rikenellaceae bacterium]
MTPRAKTIKVWIHILAWMALILLNFVLTKGYSFTVDAWDNLISWIAYILLFYASYLVLIPRFLFRKRVFGYLFLTVAALVIAFGAIRYGSVRVVKRQLKSLETELVTYKDAEESFGRKEHEQRIERARAFYERIRQDSLMRAGRGGEFGDRSAFNERDFERRELDLTPREQEFRKLDREYDHFRSYYRGIRKEPYNPFRIHNIPLIYSLFFFYLASLALAYFEKSRRSEQRRQEVESDKITTELAYLKQQINPHFLFNTLNSIYSYTIGVSAIASDAVLKLSSILRYMLYEANREKVLLADELRVVYDYIELQKMRLTEKTRVSIIVEGTTEGCRIEPMLLIPILENAFKYGVDSVEPSFVDIVAAVVRRRFEFRVSNRVVLRNGDDNLSSGIGIRNIRRRLDLIYDKEYSFTTEEKNGIFYVTLQLNLVD